MAKRPDIERYNALWTRKKAIWRQLRALRKQQAQVRSAGMPSAAYMKELAIIQAQMNPLRDDLDDINLEMVTHFPSLLAYIRKLEKDANAS